jgi:predicted secreted protein
VTVFSGIVVFTCIWWTVIFCVLPLGMAREHEPQDQLSAPGAPSDPQLKKKLILTTGISIMLWLMAFALIESGWIDWHELAAQKYG